LNSPLSEIEMSLAYNKFLENWRKGAEIIFIRICRELQGFADYMKELLQDLEFEYKAITVDWRGVSCQARYIFLS